MLDISNPIFLLLFFNVHIMNIDYAKFQKKFDSRKISRELPETPNTYLVVARHNDVRIDGRVV